MEVDDEIGELYIHRWIDAQDEYNKWYEAQIIEIDSTNNNKRIKVHFKGWNQKFDTWIDLRTEPEKIRYLNTFTKPFCDKYGDINIDNVNIGLKIDILDSMDQWFTGTVIDIDINKKLIKVTYDKWSDKWDEWILHDSYRLAPHNTMSNAQFVQQNNANKKHNNDSNNDIDAKVINADIDQSSDVDILHQNNNNNNNNVYNNDTDDIGSSDKKYDIEDDLDSSDRYDNRSNNRRRTNNNNDNNSNNNSDDADDDNDNDNDNIKDKNEKKRRDFIKRYKASKQHEKEFRQKMIKKDMKIVNMGDDGNCLFRSISHQMYGTQDFHVILRKKCVEYLISEKNYFSSFAPGGLQYFDHYCNHMAKDTVWGNQLVIQVFGELYRRNIEIYAYENKPNQTFKYALNKPIHNDNIKPINNTNQPIRLSYHFNSHYNSIINIKDHKFIYNMKDVGMVEDAQIQWSSLRSINALNKTIEESDKYNTNNKLMEFALKESRKQFESNMDNKNVDELIITNVLKESLKDFENDQLNRVIEKSKKDIENDELSKVIEKSKKDMEKQEEILLQKQMELIAQNELERVKQASLNELNSKNDNINDNNNDLNNNTTNNAINACINVGYTLEDSQLAYLSCNRNGITQQTLISNMLDWIKMKTISQQFYN